MKGETTGDVLIEWVGGRVRGGVGGKKTNAFFPTLAPHKSVLHNTFSRVSFSHT